MAGNGEARFAELPSMVCSADTCVAVIDRDGRKWRLLATLTRDYVDRAAFEPACAAADIVISDRRMPRWCRPRWRVFDRAALAETGAVAVWLAGPRVRGANMAAGDHPWRPHPNFRPHVPAAAVQTKTISHAASIDRPTPPPTRSA